MPSLDVEWQAGRHHRLAARVQKIDRDSSAQTLTEIQWGDETIPVDSQIDLTFDIFQYFLDYTYYPWVKERWAAGVGLGLRVMDISSSLTWQGNYIGEGGQDSFSVTGPLPYLYFEYRRMFSKNWRFITGLGWLYVKVGDIEGGQWLGRASIEYQVGERWSFGGALNLASVDADWKNLERPEDEDELSGNVDIDIDDVSIFVKVRF